MGCRYMGPGGRRTLMVSRGFSGGREVRFSGADIARSAFLNAPRRPLGGNNTETDVERKWALSRMI